jgi:predicted nucleotidyltransferase component of viral defense system
VIRKEEILELRAEWGLREEVIEKDYVLGWTLAAIAAHPILGDTWVFKGGTALKKCHFETYRFSEDLDFTVAADGPSTPDDVQPVVQELAAWLYDRAGITVHADRCRCIPRVNKRKKPTCQVRFVYTGPLQMPNSQQIKFDLTADERLVLPPERRPVVHLFSDQLPVAHVLTYPLAELFAEKLRALAERCRPRDLYDVVHIHRHGDLSDDLSNVRDALRAKCAFAGIPVPTYASIRDSPLATAVEADWAAMLGHQLPALPDVDAFWQALEPLFAWLETAAPVPALRRAERSIDELTDWRPPPTMARWDEQAPLELIRFAGANRLKVDLDYVAERGRKGWRRGCEPYSLRRTRRGRLLLYLVNDRGQLRSYGVDRIRSVAVTSDTFIPRYLVEF